MDAQAIAKKARKSISRYCMDECASYCCRKGYLVLTEKQAGIILGPKMEEFMQKDLLTRLKDGKFSMFMGTSDSPCPMLDEKFMCRIHKNRDRPQACKEFPVFIDEKEKVIVLSQRCPAVRQGLLYKYECMFLKLGYKLMGSSPYSELEFRSFK